MEQHRCSILVFIKCINAPLSKLHSFFQRCHSWLTLGHDSRPRSSGKRMLLLFCVCLCVCEEREREGESFVFVFVFMANDKLLK